MFPTILSTQNICDRTGRHKSTPLRPMTDLEIIEKLGGAVAIAAELGIERTAVTNWKRRGISAAGRYQIRDLAKRKRVALPKDFMNRKPNEER